MFPVDGPNEYEEKLNNRKNELSARFASEGKTLAQKILDQTIQTPDQNEVSLYLSGSENQDEIIDSAMGMLRESGWKVETYKPWGDGFFKAFRDENVVRRLRISSASGQRQFTAKLLSLY